MPPSRASYMPEIALDGDTDGTCHISKPRVATMTRFVPISVTHTHTHIDLVTDRGATAAKTSHSL